MSLTEQQKINLIVSMVMENIVRLGLVEIADLNHLRHELDKWINAQILYQSKIITGFIITNDLETMKKLITDVTGVPPELFKKEGE